MKNILIKELGSKEDYKEVSEAFVQGKSDYLKILSYNKKVFSEITFESFLSNEIKSKRIKSFSLRDNNYLIDVYPKIEEFEIVD